MRQISLRQAGMASQALLFRRIETVCVPRRLPVGIARGVPTAYGRFLTSRGQAAHIRFSDLASLAYPGVLKNVAESMKYPPKPPCFQPAESWFQRRKPTACRHQAPIYLFARNRQPSTRNRPSIDGRLFRTDRKSAIKSDYARAWKTDWQTAGHPVCPVAPRAGIADGRSDGAAGAVFGRPAAHRR